MMIEEKNVIEQRKDKYRTEYNKLDLKEAVEKMDQVRGIKDKVEAKLAEINAAYDVLRIELVPTLMENAGVETVRYEGIGRVSLTGDMWLHTQDQEGLFKWLRKRRLGDLIKETVHPGTLKATMKNLINAGKEVPPKKIVSIEPYTRASITKSG